jgi:von Willebrand factor type A domain
MVEFLSPLGWLVACAAVLPLGAAALRRRRERPMRRLLLLAPPPRTAGAAAAAAAVLAIALLAAATARPAISTAGGQRLRSDAQVFFVVDVSRSMLARRRHGRTRFERALSAAETILSRLSDVPAGVASLSDRPLPHLFPTGDRQVFSAVLHRSIGIQRPAASVGSVPNGVETTFDPLDQLATAGYFGRGIRHRLVILLTDGESIPYSPNAVATQLQAGHVGLLVVRFWNADERVYRPGGRIEPYRPDPGAIRQLELLAPGRIYPESRTSAVVRAARQALGTGPSVTIGQPRRFELAPYAALAAVLPIAFLLRRRDP